MPEKTISVEIEVWNQNAKDVLREAVQAVPGFRMKSEGGQYSDLVMLEVGQNPEREFEQINHILASGMTEAVFLTSPDINPEILLESLRAGVKEFFPQPIQKNNVVNALVKFKERRGNGTSHWKASKNGKIISLLGSNGGAGTTTLAVNLAASLLESSEGSSVALIDMALPFGNVPVFLDIHPASDWMAIVRNASRLDATYLMGTLTKHDSGLQVLPAPEIPVEESESIPFALADVLGLMRTMFDFIIIDTGRAVDYISKRIFEVSDTVLLVSVLELPSLVSAKNILAAFNVFGYPPEDKVKVICSRFRKKSLIPLSEAEESLRKKFSAAIPDEPQLASSAINQGKPLLLLDREAEISKRIRDLASSLSGKGESQTKERSFLGLKFKVKG